MPTSGVRVEGLQERVRALLALGLEVNDLKQAFGAIAQKAATAARSFVPTRTGRLQKTIKPVQRKNYAGVRAGTRRVPYAKPINYGWPKHNITARHFMQKADDAVKTTARSELETQIARLIREKGLS